MHTATFHSQSPGVSLPTPQQAVSLPMELLFELNLQQHRRLFSDIAMLRPVIGQAAVLLADSLHRGGRLLLAGCGPSAATCLHLAAVFNIRLRQNHLPEPAIVLTDDTSPGGFVNERVCAQAFAREVLANAHAPDCLVLLSTAAETASLVRVLQAARSQGVASVALLGRSPGAAGLLADIAVLVPHYESARIHEAHLFIGHTWCGQIESALGLVP